MSLLGEIGEALRGALGGEEVFPPATLHALTRNPDGSVPINADGRQVRALTDVPAFGFASRWDHKIIASKGWDPKTLKIVLVQSNQLQAPQVGDEASAVRPLNGTVERILVSEVTSDPADATWILAGVPA